MLIVAGTILGAIFFSSCHSSVNHYKKDDTTVALKILLDSAFYKPRLVPPGSFSDTIIFQYNDILVHYLPKQLSYKLLKEDEMCRFMAVRKISHLQFLSLEEFIKTSNGYRTALGTHCVWRGAFTVEPDQRTDTLCEREKYCNAVFYMDVRKTGSTLTGSRFRIMTY